ncbi:hypothetical protein XMD509_001208 [Marinobacterium sp. xm-d-509]|nr:hypothetical protein [Marinobacterium sp. xm-g-48]NRP82944.1 hypothetical protein [Marinobacterium sp. xm-d-509]
MICAEWITIVKDIVVALAAGITAIVAYKGINKWQSELHGKAEFEVARDLMRATYKLRDELAYCRSPFVSSNEFPENYNSSESVSNKENADAWAHVYSKRWNPVGDAIRQFDMAVLEAEALWGADIKNKAMELRQCAHTLHIDIDAFIADKLHGGQDFENKDFAEKVRSSLNDIKLGDENPLTKRILAAISQIEIELKNHLKR